VCFIYGLEEKNSKSEVISAVNVMLNLSNVTAEYIEPKATFFIAHYTQYYSCTVLCLGGTVASWVGGKTADWGGTM